jgi:hypothetical protein
VLVDPKGPAMPPPGWDIANPRAGCLAGFLEFVPVLYLRVE